MSGDGSTRPQDVEQIAAWLDGMPVLEERIAALPRALQPAGRAIAGANGSGRWAAVEQVLPELVPLLQDEVRARHGDAGGPPQFPTEALPEPLRQLVKEGALACGVPPELVAIPLLAVVAGVLGNTASLHFKRTWIEYSSLYLAVVAVPGATKTPAMKVAAAPLKALVDEAFATYEYESQQYREDHAAWEASGGKKSHDPEPQPPVRRDYQALDHTMEAIYDVLRDNPGLVFLFDEMSSWVTGFDKYRGGSGGDRKQWLSAWSSAAILVHRKGGAMYVPNPVVAVAGGIQPEMLPDLAAEAGRSDGFLERILWAYPITQPSHLTDDDVSHETFQQVAALLRTLRHRPEPGQAVVVLSAEARDLFRAWHRENTEQARQVSGIVQGTYAKLPSQLLRLVLILHCAYHAEAPARTSVRPEIVQDAILLIEYFRSHALRALAAIGTGIRSAGSVAEAPVPDPAQLLAERLLRTLRRLGPGWHTVRAITHALSGKESAAARRAARDELVTKGQIEVDIRPSAGRPAEVWQLVGATADGFVTSMDGNEGAENGAFHA